MKAKRGSRAGSIRNLNLILQGKLLSIASKAESLSWVLARAALLLCACIIVACATKPQPSRTILPDPQWTEDGWQWRDLNHKPQMRGDPPIPRPLIEPPEDDDGLHHDLAQR